MASIVVVPDARINERDSKVIFPKQHSELAMENMNMDSYEDEPDREEKIYVLFSSKISPKSPR